MLLLLHNVWLHFIAVHYIFWEFLYTSDHHIKDSAAQFLDFEVILQKPYPYTYGVLGHLHLFI